jgi:type II secretory pathway component PulF
MPSFKYESLTGRGQARSGVLNAADRGDAVRQLLARGETAVRLSEDGAKPAASNGVARTLTAMAPASSQPGTGFSIALPSLVRRKPSLRRADMANLVREIATALEAGLPLMQALRTVRRQAAGRALPVILDHLIERVEAGDPIHAAARDYGPPFDEMIVGMLRAADASGDMSKILHQLADLLDRSVELRREVMGATMYPMIIAALIAFSIIVLVTVLVPKLIEPLAAEITLPAPTKIVLGFADFVSSYWLIALVLVIAVSLGWRAWKSVPANRVLVDRTILKVPVLGRLLRDIAVARFTRTLGTLTTSGLPILDALRITRNTLGNAAMMIAVDQVQDQVTSGKSLADPLERSGLFPPLLVQVVNLGERSGRLESMLLHAAGAFDRQVNASLKLFTKLLPPVLLIIMAGIGGFVLAAILLPLLELQNLVR